MLPSTSAISIFILLFYLLSSFSHVKCSGTKAGNNKQDHKCETGYYEHRKPGRLTCQRCTQVCNGHKNQVEVAPCSHKKNRLCHCKPGFYCSKGDNYTTYCNTACKRCEAGTFSNIPTLIDSCSPHTVCKYPEMIMLKEGTATEDRVCVFTTTRPSTSRLSRTTAISSSSVSITNTSNAITSIISNTTSIPNTEGTSDHLYDKPKESQTHWFMLLILLLILLCMTGFCMLRKGKAEKTLSKCSGFINGKNESQDCCRQMDIRSCSSYDCNVEAGMPFIGDQGRKTKGQKSSGGVQQVTMEHSGKGENVSNTVGSIYIYSPGTVILGSSSGDKKEDAGVCEEALPLMSRPQQESNPPSQELRIQMSTPEEVDEELSLSFPVPATGK